MIIEMILLTLAPYPYFDLLEYHEYNDQFNIWFTYSANDLLLCLSFLRFYIVVRYALVASKFTDPRSKRICSMNGCDADL